MKRNTKSMVLMPFFSIYIFVIINGLNGACCLGKNAVGGDEYEIIESLEYQLLKACYRGESKKAERLLSDSQGEIDINCKDDNNNTALMLLFDYGNTHNWFKTTLKGERGRLMLRLLTGGIDLAVQNNNGETALMKALYEPEIYLVPELLKYGARAPSIINIQDNNGMTALMHTVAGGVKSISFTKHRECLDMAKLLVDADADITLKNNQGKTALDIIGNDVDCQPLKRYIHRKMVQTNVCGDCSL